MQADYTLHLGDCLEVMPTIPAGSIDAIIADWPYGQTACKWDSVIPIAQLWKECKRVIKLNGAIVLTASQPFTSALVISNLTWFRYDLVWDKVNPSGFLNVNRQPLRSHESILLFCQGQSTYNPQKVLRPSFWRRKGGYEFEGESQEHKGIYREGLKKGSGYRGEYKNPISIIEFNTGGPQLKAKQKHPTQKPVALMEYLIRTYTNPGDLVLDNTMGSGSTGEACLRTERRFVGIELMEEYYSIAQTRLERVEQELGEAQIAKERQPYLIAEVANAG